MTHPAGPRRTPARRRGWVRPALAAAFVLVPLAEIWAILQVGQLVGPWWTILLLVLDSMVGAWLIKREGGRAWRALREALQGGRMPARELADGALILIGGTLMLSPGFLLDAVGILLILPFTRPVARRLLTTVVERRLVVVPGATGFGSGFGSGFGPGLGFGPGSGPGPVPGNGRRPGPEGEGPVVQGDVVE
ncbi:FxsA cytoplasmic membrane protein [metagenome]|uniref:FxsA cytoplasmic membrane protein n=1 Tax=metagenome TaxID=256318 RepID=A0A2P2CE77_9ZZZZ